jgi:AraC-like DNA-binding protein
MLSRSSQQLSPQSEESLPGVMSARWTQYGVQGLEAVGVDVAALCPKVGLSYESVTDPGAWVEHARFVRLWSLAVRDTGDTNLGLRAAEHFKPVARDLVSHLLICCRTLGEGVAKATGFFDGAGDTAGARIEVRDSETVFRLAHRKPDHAAWVEFRLAAYWRFAEMAAQRELCPTGTRFRHADRGGSRELYERVYRCRVSFSALENALAIPAEVLSLPLPFASEETARALEKAASEAVLKPRSYGIEGKVRTLVRTSIPHGDHSESAIASALHMSERTLKRRLAESELSFSAIVDDVRQRLALDLILSTGQTLENVAAQVGYSGPGSLVRAVKRWTGQTPASLRSEELRARSA